MVDVSNKKIVMVLLVALVVVVIGAIVSLSKLSGLNKSKITIGKVLSMHSVKAVESKASSLLLNAS